MIDTKLLVKYLKDREVKNVIMGRSYLDSPRTILIIDDIPSTPTPLGITKHLSFYYKSIKLVLMATNNYNASRIWVNDLYHWFAYHPYIAELGWVQVVPEMPVFIERVKDLYKFVMILDVIYDRQKIAPKPKGDFGLEAELEST